jgi:hypothetical protein
VAIAGKEENCIPKGSAMLLPKHFQTEVVNRKSIESGNINSMPSVFILKDRHGGVQRKGRGRGHAIPVFDPRP